VPIIQDQRNNQAPHCPRPTPRSGWRVSLRRETLAQAWDSRSGEPPSPRRAPPPI